MAATKISDMTDGVTPVSTDESPWARAGANVKMTYEQIKDAVMASPEATALAATARWLEYSTSGYTAELPTIDVSTVSYTKTVSTTTGNNIAPIVVTTTTNHGLITGEKVTIAGVTGNTAANGTWYITKLTDTTFELTLEALTSPHLTSLGNGAYSGGPGTVTHDMHVTTSTHHRLNSLTHVTIKDIVGTTAANGIHTIDSGTVRIIGSTGSGASPIVLTTAFEHGFVANSQIRVEGVEGNTAANGIWYVSCPSSTTIGLYEAAGPATASTGNGAYDDGGTASRSKSFRLVGKAGNAAYTSGGKVIIPGRITVELGTPGLTDQRQTDVFPTATSSTSTRQAAEAAAEALGFGIGVPIKITQAIPAAVALTGASNAVPIVCSVAGHTFLNGSSVTISGVTGNTNANGTWLITGVTATTFTLVGSGGNGVWGGDGTATLSYPATIYGLIVGVPGREGFPYTDPEPLPFYLDDQVQYVGPPLLYNITALYLGKPELVEQQKMELFNLPHFGAVNELPVTRLSGGAERYRTVGSGALLGFFGKSYARMDAGDAYCVSFSLQNRDAAVAGGTNTLSGGSVRMVQDYGRAGTFGASAVSYAKTLIAWVAATAYRAQDEVLYRTGGATTAYNHYRARREHGLAWDSGTAYVVGDIAVTATVPYRCILAHTNQAQPNATYWVTYTPKSNPNLWRQIAGGEAYGAGILYVKGDYTTSGGLLYLCILATGGGIAPPNTTYWELADPDCIPLAWDSGYVGGYADGNIVFTGGKHYISLQAANTTNPLADDRNGTPLWWDEVSRATYTDGGLYAGARATKRNSATVASTANEWPSGLSTTGGNPDTGVAGWTFRALGEDVGVGEHPSPTEIILESQTLKGDIVFDSWDSTASYVVGNQVTRSSAKYVCIQNHAAFKDPTTEPTFWEPTSVTPHIITDVDRLPRISVAIGGQNLSTNDDHHGTRTRVYSNRAEWNPSNEINPNVYDTEYNARLELTCTGVGNAPGRRTTEDITEYSTGTITVVDGVVTLAGGTWPQWAAAGAITIDDETSLLNVSVRTSDTLLTLTNLTIQAAAGSSYVLTPKATPAKYLTCFLTFVAH